MGQIVVMPMMGMPLFSGSVSMAMGGFVGHLIYGAAIGTLYRASDPTVHVAAPA